MASSEDDKVLVMAATNMPHELDDAALRFVTSIAIPYPLSLRESEGEKTGSP